MKRSLSLILTALLGLGAPACETHNADHSHKFASHDHQKTKADGGDDHSSHKYGHKSAVYECGDVQLESTYAKTGSTLSYAGTKINVSREFSNGTETFLGTLNGEAVSFIAKANDGQFSQGAKRLSCEKLTCIPLDGPI